MKLDRNVNQDGRGKYALINLRTNKVEWGGDGGDQFFVLKYKDIFAAPALQAYAKACRDYAAISGAGTNQQRALIEFAAEVEREAEQALRCGEKLPD